MPDKTTITAHIDQLKDMQTAYPEIKNNIQPLVNHLTGLRRIVKINSDKSINLQPGIAELHKHSNRATV